MLCTGLVFAISGVLSTTAQAAAIALYVAPAANGGSDTGNNCTFQADPCATIEHAIDEAALQAPNSTGSVINLSKGTFDSSSDTMFAGLGNGANAGLNGNLTITGTGGSGNGATVVEPTSCSSLATVTGAGSPDSGDRAIVVFDDPGVADTIDGVTVENMELDGAGIAGGACPSYKAGVIDTGPTVGDAVVGDVVQSGAIYGILTDDGADSTIISDILAPVPCTTTVKGPNTGLNAGWTSPANLKIKAVPRCAKFIEGGHGAATGVFINGVAYCTTASATRRTLVLTGTPGSGGCPNFVAITNSGGVEIPTGATVYYNTSVAPFTQWGIACNSPVGPADAGTDCAVSDDTVTAGGSVYADYPPADSCGGTPPIGIVVTGSATANIDGNRVDDVADTIGSCPEAGESTQDAIGIGLIPNTTGCSAGNSIIGVNDTNEPNTGAGNKLGSTSANDVGIAVSGNVSGSCSGAPSPSYQVNGNTVASGVEAGIDLTNLEGVNGGFASPPSSNSVAGVTQGAGIEMEGVDDQAIGGALASAGNTLSGNEMGLVLAPCVPYPPATNPPGCTVYAGGPGSDPSDGNLIQNNTMTGNVAFGVLTVGQFQPNEFAGDTGASLESADNTFDANSWGTATSAANGTLSSVINGAEILDGSAWGGGCGSESGDCTTAGVGPLIFEGPTRTFSSSSPGAAIFTLSICNSGVNSDVLPRGTEITLNASGQSDDGGTFFVTQDAVITGNVGCTGTFYNLSLQAIAPAEVGTLNSPSGQPYNLGAGDTILVNANGSTVVHSANLYGRGATANSCTPADVDQSSPPVVTPDVFGATDPPSSPFAYSTTLQASTGGVNATYGAC
jgi:hypothetical protein